MELIVVKLIFAFLTSFLFTLYLVPLFSSIAFKLGVLDVPDGRIKKHEKPIPYLGGVAVYVGFILSLALTLSFDNRLIFLLVGATLLLFIGLIDDLINLKPYQKFAGQFIAAFCLVRSGLYLKESFFLNNFWGIPLSMLWILSIVNAFNLIDVMDGLACSAAASAGITFFIFACLSQQWQVALLLASFIGPVVAFLWYNKPPASIYLGDAGSLFIGGVLAIVPFLQTWSLHNPFAFIAPAIILAIPLLEVGTLIVVRTYKGIPFYKPSPDHFSIYLRQNGWTKFNILLYVFSLSLGLFLSSLAIVLNKVSFLQFVLLSIIFCFIWFFFLLINFRLPVKFVRSS
ncbi:undecaprenyl/decaprenyl-phosphate alpha-N-acetylglucosaminyl 1-phosphate transferase [Candidatus Dependentiae bacterium]|nr:undecaprenyl/decaprenyl-phosphate alpha-N-acetylglucosaminyl 1-phosphate transferase [Candidatus Dependentiae bacterium]